MLAAEALFTDHINKRLIISIYPRNNIDKAVKYMIKTALDHSLEKIWIWAYPEDVNIFKKYGFVVEGCIEANIPDRPNTSMAYYVKPQRSQSIFQDHEDALLRKAFILPAKSISKLGSLYSLHLLTPKNCQEISHLLSSVFTTYPTPVHKPDYIHKLMKDGCIFGGIYYDEKLVSMAAAYSEKDLGRYEMTDCATLDQHRGLSLTERIIRHLEELIRKRDEQSYFYTLARAGSLGVNRVFYNLGYNYQGRLINNCTIGGRFENMNLWVKL